MAHGHAVLGETPELFMETEAWTIAEMKIIERNERARKQVLDSIQPLLEKKKEKLIHEME